MKKNLFAVVIAFGLILSPFIVSAARTAVQSVSGYFTTSPAPHNSDIYYTGGSVGIGSTTPYANGLAIQGVATTTGTPLFNVASSSGISLFSIGPTGSTTMKQYYGIGTPTVSTSTGSGSIVGTSTLAVGSTDLAGKVTIETGSIPAANATIFTLTYASAVSPFCVFSSANATSSLLSVASSTYLTNNGANFTMTSGSVGLISSTTYAWNYLCN